MQSEVEILVFSAPWCASCKVLKKNLEGNNIKYVEVNVDEYGNQDLMEKYKVRGLPTTIGLRGEDVVLSMIGAGAIQDILKLLEG